MGGSADVLGVGDLALSLVAGALGLVVIEWGVAGNLPGSEASQFVMFTTWAGVAAFARVATAPEPELAGVRRLTVRVFVWFAAIVTGAGLMLLAVAPGLAFAVTFLAANVGYPLFVVPFVVAFWKRDRARGT